MVTMPLLEGWLSGRRTLRGNLGEPIQEDLAIVRQADLGGAGHAEAACDQVGV